MRIHFRAASVACGARPGAIACSTDPPPMGTRNHPPRATSAPRRRRPFGSAPACVTRMSCASFLPCKVAAVTIPRRGSLKGQTSSFTRKAWRGAWPRGGRGPRWTLSRPVGPREARPAACSRGPLCPLPRPRAGLGPAPTHRSFVIHSLAIRSFAAACCHLPRARHGPAPHRRLPHGACAVGSLILRRTQRGRAPPTFPAPEPSLAPQPRVARWCDS